MNRELIEFSQWFSETMVWLRFFLYPFVIYNLFSIGIIYKDRKNSLAAGVHVSIGIMMTIYWTALITSRILGYVELGRWMIDTLITPAILIVCVLGWEDVLVQEKNYYENGDCIQNKNVTNSSDCI